MITPHTARPAPSATTSVCKIEIAEVKNAILIYGTGISVFTIFLISCKSRGKGGANPVIFPGPIIRPSLLPFPMHTPLPCPWHCPFPKFVYSLSFSVEGMLLCIASAGKKNNKKSLLLKPATMRLSCPVFTRRRISCYTSTPCPHQGRGPYMRFSLPPSFLLLCGQS